VWNKYQERTRRGESRRNFGERGRKFGIKSREQHLLRDGEAAPRSGGDERKGCRGGRSKNSSDTKKREVSTRGGLEDVGHRVTVVYKGGNERRGSGGGNREGEVGKTSRSPKGEVAEKPLEYEQGGSRTVALTGLRGHGGQKEPHWGGTRKNRGKSDGEGNEGVKRDWIASIRENNGGRKGGHTRIQSSNKLYEEERRGP